MSDAPKTYSWSVDEEHYFGEFATVEEALEDAFNDENAEVVYVGERRDPTAPEHFWDASDWLEHVACQDDYSIEQAEYWDSSTKEQRAELEEEVQKVMAAWLDRHGMRPGFWLIGKVKKYRNVEGKWEST